MKPVFPKGWNPPPVVQTRRFTPVFERELSPARITHLMRHAYGWANDEWAWPFDRDARLQEPAMCASWAAVNAFKAFCHHNGRGKAFDSLDPRDVHGDAQEIDGLEGGQAETATTIQAAMEAICEIANGGLREPWVYWSPVSVDLTGVWQKSVSPVVADLYWPREWNHHSVIWKTLLYSHANAQKGRHAIALMGHRPKKRAGLFRKPVRAFLVQDSEKGEPLWIEVGAMAAHWVGGCGFILASQWEQLKRDEEREPNPMPLA